MENYKPSIKEIYACMKHERSLDGDRLLNDYHMFESNSSYAGSIAIWALITAPLIIPTVIRRFKDGVVSEYFQKVGGSGNIYTFLGPIAGTLGVIYELAFFNYFIDSGHLEVLVIPAVTNTVSTLHEIRNYRKARQRLIEEHEKQNLESIVKK